jgi:hypothetical protein
VLEALGEREQDGLVVVRAELPAGLGGGVQILGCGRHAATVFSACHVCNKDTS